MYFTNLLNQLSFLNIVCFSFFIVLLNLLFNKENSNVRILGIAFLTPFAFNITAFLINKPKITIPLIMASELVMSIVLFLHIKHKSGTGSFRRDALLSVTALILLIPSIIYIPAFRKYLAMTELINPVIILISVLTLFLFRKKKKSDRLLIWAIASETAICLIRLFDSYFILNLIVVSFRFILYFSFFLYFYKVIYHQLMKIAEEAEKQLKAINRDLNLEVKKRVFEIELSNEKLIEISKTDALTKALNKAGLLDKIDSYINSSKTKEFCLLMFDIDSFKSINDNLGHITGDKCLKKLSLIAKESIREVDSIGRYGGDEFIIVLPNASIPQARIIAERFRKNVAQTETPHFTVSVGLASFPADGTTVKELIAVADEGLYVSKKKGKNAVSYKTEF